MICELPFLTKQPWPKVIPSTKIGTIANLMLDILISLDDPILNTPN